MKERERILDLVKKGVLSTEEALVLLENMTNAAQHQNAAKDASDMDAAADKVSEPQQSQAAAYLAKITELKEAMSRKEEELLAARHQYDAALQRLQAEQDQSTEDAAQLEREVDTLEETVDALEDAIDEFADHIEELQDLFEEEQAEEATRADWSKTHRASGSERRKKQEKFERKMEDLARKLGKGATKWGRKFEEQVESGEFNRKMDKLFRSIGAVFSGIQWDTQRRFTRTYRYASPELTIFDIQNANGSVTIKGGEADEVVVAADVMLSHKLAEESSEAAFVKRSVIEATSEKLTFSVPNKQVYCDITITVPERQLDYVSVKVLSGTIYLESLTGSDFFAKVTNGNVRVTNVTGSMLESHAVNGSIYVKQSRFNDVVAKTISGHFKSDSQVESQSLETQNGSILVKVSDAQAKRLVAKTTNGPIVVYVPVDKNISGTVHTLSGRLHNLLSNHEAQHTDEQMGKNEWHFERFQESDQGDAANLSVELSTVCGNVTVKDLSADAADDDDDAATQQENPVEE